MRIAILIIGLSLFFIVGLQSCVVSAGGALGEDTGLSAAGSAGVLMALLSMIGAAFVMQKPKVSGVCFGLAAFTAALGAAQGSFNDLYLWGVGAGVLSVISFFAARDGTVAAGHSASGDSSGISLSLAACALAGVASVGIIFVGAKLTDREHEPVSRSQPVAPAQIAGTSTVLNSAPSPSDVTVSNFEWAKTDTFGDDTVITWTADVTNSGATPVLSADVEITFFAENGLPLASDTMVVKAIAPGETQSATEIHVDDGRASTARAELIGVDYAN
ncbi:hypothetical protein ACFOMD_17300 [Sphingoaurantiacus capsulatus]|uniref:CARDB domain-containing protein n=1 Tax=Sphingoaurantiacus capsulatus TaxID=1771310 RepID=A0ABV7XHX8_9SPHN